MMFQEKYNIVNRNQDECGCVNSSSIKIMLLLGSDSTNYIRVYFANYTRLLTEDETTETKILHFIHSFFRH